MPKNTPSAADQLRFPCCGHEHYGACAKNCKKCIEDAKPEPAAEQKPKENDQS